MSSVIAAQAGIERAFHWGYADRNFGNGNTVSAAPLSPCGLYGGTLFPAAAAGHLFGENGTATLLEDLQNRTSGPATKSDDDGGAIASGIGGWGAGGGELRLLVSLFAPRKDERPIASACPLSGQCRGAAASYPRMRARALVYNNEPVYTTPSDAKQLCTTAGSLVMAQIEHISVGDDVDGHRTGGCEGSVAALARNAA